MSDAEEVEAYASSASQAYLDAYPDVRAVKTNPLVHYMQKGRYENRAIMPSTAKPPVASSKR